MAVCRQFGGYSFMASAVNMSMSYTAPLRYLPDLGVVDETLDFKEEMLLVLLFDKSSVTDPYRLW